MSIAHIRKEYQKATLDEREAPANPIALFDTWFHDAVRAEVAEPNAMCLSTAGDGKHPEARIVLLKGFNQEGFEFFTNYHSQKGQALMANPFCSLTFFWPEVERQVRVNGESIKLTPEESDAYFASRPRGSQIGAWVSQQSERLESREQLEQRLKETRESFEEKEIIRPPHWGGYRVIPWRIEFWQGRPNRLHDRLLYERVTNTAWNLVRLSP
ncbi:MAG: pyridoxamine 5'-phosphate oxidase [Bacteroidia bacterium]